MIPALQMKSFFFPVQIKRMPALEKEEERREREGRTDGLGGNRTGSIMAAQLALALSDTVRPKKATRRHKEAREEVG